VLAVLVLLRVQQCHAQLMVQTPCLVLLHRLVVAVAVVTMTAQTKTAVTVGQVAVLVLQRQHHKRQVQLAQVTQLKDLQGH
jgi:hypothetical protein